MKRKKSPRQKRATYSNPFLPPPASHELLDLLWQLELWLREMVYVELRARQADWDTVIQGLFGDWPPHAQPRQDMRVTARPLFLMTTLLGCSSVSPTTAEGRDYGYEAESKLVWVRGPWEIIQPSRDIDEVIDQLCPAIITLPRATLRDYGQEYCGALYTMGDETYYASFGSPLGRTELIGPTKRKTCYSPASVRDSRGEAHPVADFHGHPWAPSPMSQVDRSLKTQRWQIRIQFDTACHIQKLVPNKDSSLPGELYERQGKNWKLIGRILPEDKEKGHVTATDE